MRKVTLDFFKGKITESHLGKELLEKVDLTEDNASRLEEFFERVEGRQR